MSVQEIEKAITQLQGDEFNQLIKWLEKFQFQPVMLSTQDKAPIVPVPTLKPLRRFSGTAPVGWKEALYGE